MMPEFVPHTEEQILAARIGQVQPLNGRIVLVDYDPEWPRLFEREAEREVLGLLLGQHFVGRDNGGIECIGVLDIGVETHGAISRGPPIYRAPTAQLSPSLRSQHLHNRGRA